MGTTLQNPSTNFSYNSKALQPTLQVVKLPFALGLFAFVHNIKKRGKTLLSAFSELLSQRTLQSPMSVLQRGQG